MIRKLTCRNFRSWREPGPIALAPLTLFFGCNGSGKTTLLQILLLLKQTAESSGAGLGLELGEKGGLVEAESFETLVFGRDLAAPLELGFEWQLPFSLHVNDPARQQGSLFHGNTLELTTVLGWHGGAELGRGGGAVSRMAYGFAGSEFGMKLADPGTSTYELFHTLRDFRLRRKTSQSSPLPPPIKCHGFPREAMGGYENLGFLRDFETQLEQRLAQVFYLGPLREPPKRRASWMGDQPTDVGRHGEQVLEALLAARKTGKTLPAGRGRMRQTVEERVLERLRQFARVEGFELRPLKTGSKQHEAWVRRHSGGTEIPLADVGGGLAQLLPILTLCYYVPEGATLVLEKPETALDPALQACLADVFIEVALTRDVQILVESHSEPLLRRLQRRIAEERLKPRQTALYFCSSEQGESRLTKLQLDRYGALASWPEGFFDDGLTEITAMSRAALERQTRSSG